MEYVDAILYHKMQESDLTNMYAIKKPDGGGGQTYIQAAGYSREELDGMFHDADTVRDTAEFWDSEKRFPRKDYTFEAYAVGGSDHAPLELAPRTGRKDYRICRQNPRNRHPAWRESSGFPAPRRGPTGSYIFEPGYPGIIDNLYILIIKTWVPDAPAKYYAGYVDAPSLPASWPSGAGLEEIFSPQKRQGILSLREQYLRFVNDRTAPFQAGSAADAQLGNVVLPAELNETAADAVEFADKEISLHIDPEHLRFIKTPPPAPKTARRPASGRTVAKGINYAHRQKNLKRIGDAGDHMALAMEKARLIQEGRPDLAKQVEHVSALAGDGLGYDIKSFEDLHGTYEEKYIEVKTTTGGWNKPFDISANEVEVSAEKGEHYCICRFYGLSDNAAEMKYYEVRGPVAENFRLEPTAYKAYYNA